MSPYLDREAGDRVFYLTLPHTSLLDLGRAYARPFFYFPPDIMVMPTSEAVYGPSCTRIGRRRKPLNGYQPLESARRNVEGNPGDLDRTPLLPRASEGHLPQSRKVTEWLAYLVG